MKTLYSLADDFLEFLQTQPLRCLIYFTVFYFGCTLTSSRLKIFWYDELATFYISKLPDWNSILIALSAGADLNPPTLYFFTRLSHMLFGDGEVATRMPATLGFLLFLLCLHRYVARLTNNAIACAAMCFPLVTGAYAWAFEARPYGIMLGMLGLAILFWQRAGTSGQPKMIVLSGLALSLGIAVSTQAFAVLSIGPFILAELVRFWQTRQPRWGIWVAMMLPFSVLWLYLPLLATQNTVVMNNAAFRPELASIPLCYHMLLDSTVFPLGLVLFVTILTSTGSGDESNQVSAHQVSDEHIALAAGFLLIPVAAVAVAMVVTHVFYERYGLPAIVGITIVLALVLARSGNRRAPVYATVIFCFWTISALIQLPAFAGAPPIGISNRVPIEKLRPELPVVISNGFIYMKLAHYADAGFKRRLNFLTDPKAGLTYTGTNVLDVAFPMIKNWYRIAGNIEPYNAFVQRQKHFLLIGPTINPLDWLGKKLIDDGATVRIIALHDDSTVCEVTLEP